MTMKVLIADALAEEGLAIIRQHAEVDVKLKLTPEELVATIGDYDALLVRSQTQVTANVIEAGKKLQVIGRAGVGIDNIDLDAATQCGIIVVNAPTGNTISAAEHAIALMMASARHIPQANASLKQGQWKRSAYMGTEVRGKTLGVIGLGNVGSAVARRARGLEMKILGYDPFISEEKAKSLQIELVPLEQIYCEADFITLHIPLIEATRDMIGKDEIAMMKPCCRIINCARGGLIDDQALLDAVSSGKLAGAAIDVFPKEPTTESILFGNENIIVTPHLGASTAEAQVTAACDVAEQVVEVFKGHPPRYAVNAPFIPPEMIATLAPFMKAVNSAGKLLSQLATGQISNITIKYEGDISEFDTNVLKAGVLGGLMEDISEERINLVNANMIANRRGLTVTEQKVASCENYASLVTVEATTNRGNTIVATTVMRGEPHIVRIDNHWIDIVPTGGYFMLSNHCDRPGLIGAVGNITGESDINISFMQLSRLKARGEALMVLSLDEPLSEEALQKIVELPGVYTARMVKL